MIIKNWREVRPQPGWHTHLGIEDVMAVTNGVFDILHAGHFKLLGYVYNRDYLRCEKISQIVLLNTDASVQRIKGGWRPIVTFAERAAALAELPWVHSVIGFEENEPTELIQAIRPKILVKGSEYADDLIPGSMCVLNNGGMVLFCPMEHVPGTAKDDNKYLSTSSIARRYFERP